MKTRFNSYDIVCAVAQIKSIIGHRVNQIYDVDNKTYLLKFQNNDEKNVLLMESGNRIHLTAFEWPKSASPNGFTMKLRKHLKNKRLEAIEQLGDDRIIRLQFGSGVASYHIILELYDRGNIILCDHALIILNLLRPRTEGEDVRFAVRETYPVLRARGQEDKDKDRTPTIEVLKEMISNGKPGDTLKTILNPKMPCGPQMIEHFLAIHKINLCKIPGEADEPKEEQKGKKKRKNRNKGENNANLRDFDMEKDFSLFVNVVNDIYSMMNKAKENISMGFIIQKKELKPSLDEKAEFYYSNEEFHPFLYCQFANESIKEFPTFMQAVDEFFSSLEYQRIDLKTLAQEKDALKKLSNVRNDHKLRLNELTKSQQVDRQKAELITRNQVLVDSAIAAIGSLLAKQNTWDEIETFLKERQEHQDKLALTIKKLKFHTNQITLHLCDPYRSLEDSSDNDDDGDDEQDIPAAMEVDVDLSLSAFANATNYYEQKRSAAKKEQKTIEASGKALKNAERKTHQTLKDVKVQASITKSRKTYWFEKFYWFISSENYLVIGGRDMQQNELLVKRYLRPNDIYVHAEIQGASSIIIKNPNGGEIPPKTLVEAGTKAVCYSVAWDAKVVCSTYWVHASQVSKTAPTGEYLSTGSFMIRGKKNFLPPSHLILGLGFVFKLEDSSVERHRGERGIRMFGDDVASVAAESEQLESIPEDQEILINDESGSDEELENLLNENAAGLKLSENDEQSDEKEDSDFPDIQIKIEHDTGRIDIRHESMQESVVTEEDKEETLIQAIPTKAKKVERKFKPQKKKQQQKLAVVEPLPIKDPEIKGNKNVSKRGQKGKLKKIKEKYRDQDEEDRLMAMEILQSSGVTKNSVPNEQEVVKQLSKKEVSSKQSSNLEPFEETNAAADETDMLDSLTGCPKEEDELLFAIPIVAPYQTLQAYKFKVKLTPGSGRRGKASKAAVQIFLRDKTTTQREKDLIKAVKDEFLARNMPGKVKISAPQLLKIKK